MIINGIVIEIIKLKSGGCDEQKNRLSIIFN